ncbi:sugar ABC transporter substrate-binding protein [Rodentibacter caecimuris]|uniref:Sugar ABC transporter substrate-binding protein n=1 Tax=Rodentibacter caecimuris TaxID=1796644 RepID=A0A1V3KLS9_9PAST|nr:polysaccharide biosynthesis/export family protein [Rodentibacter heylii]OOF78133.1 sugar ABC transporter substrate-binding protein [Rodentibacter heylii]
MKLQKLYIIFSVISAFISGCSTLPTSGPNHSKILDLNNQSTNVNVVELDENSVQTLYQLQQNQLFSGFNHLAQTNGYSGVANVGDVLEISIWEAPPAVLFGGTFSSEGQGTGHLTQLPPQTINTKGMISVPFVGNISVQGKTPESIAAQITAVLKRKANQPQVLVRIVNNQSSDVTVIRQGNSIRMPLTPSGEKVLDAVAAVGGSPADIQDITIQLTRTNQVKTLPFETLIADPNQNILLQSGDVVSLLTTPYSFTGLGAVGNNQQMKFSTKGLTLAEAIGKMGGLIDTRSDPRGIFVFRYVPFAQLNSAQQQDWSKRGYKTGMDVPTVYRANLLEPKSMFLIQRFPVKDKDIVYVSNAPLAEFQKFLRMIFSITSPITSTVNSVNNL